MDQAVGWLREAGRIRGGLQEWRKGYLEQTRFRDPQPLRRSKIKNSPPEAVIQLQDNRINIRVQILIALNPNGIAWAVTSVL